MPRGRVEPIRVPECVHCRHPAAKHVQSDTEVWCETCDAVCYVPANIDDTLWLGGPHDPT